MSTAAVIAVELGVMVAVLLGISGRLVELVVEVRRLRMVEEDRAARELSILSGTTEHDYRQDPRA